jgi:transposase InsO family protein
VAGRHGARCLLSAPLPERMTAVQGALAGLLTRLGHQPATVQTDRGPCFVGAEGGPSKAAPGRLTLWLWGHGIEHRLLPPGTPTRNGAVERWNGAVERSWAGEEGGLAALAEVWNWGKPAAASAERPYGGRAGWRAARMWERLARVRVERKVDRQGKSIGRAS